jgi:hypothetical protein
MSPNLSAHLGELALSLGDLQRQFRQAARLEVARAVGDAVRQFAIAAICGPSGPSRSVPGQWDDPWRQSESRSYDDVDSDETDGASARSIDVARLQAALLLGIGGARWTYLRTRQPAAAAGVGLLLVLLGLIGGRSADTILSAWSAAHDLLSSTAIPSCR